MIPGNDCDKAPDGWWCSRTKGHDGPCAARPTCEACNALGAQGPCGAHRPRPEGGRDLSQANAVKVVAEIRDRLLGPQGVLSAIAFGEDERGIEATSRDDVDRLLMDVGLEVFALLRRERVKALKDVLVWYRDQITMLEAVIEGAGDGD